MRPSTALSRNAGVKCSPPNRAAGVDGVVDEAVPALEDDPSLVAPDPAASASAAAPDAVVLVPDDAVDDALEGGDCRKLFRMQWCKT